MIMMMIIIIKILKIYNQLKKIKNQIKILFKIINKMNKNKAKKV